MRWKAYRVDFCLLSPVHSGWRKVGNLQQTRPYVTGRILWGAFTARLTREMVARPDWEDYKSTGEKVDEWLRFTYFYPSIEPNPEKISLWPWPDQQWEKFAWTFLGSYASTALENGRSAEAGSLHETEFIAPYVREESPDKKVENVYLVGYIFQREDYALNRWQDILNRLQFGGERSYGWGRVTGRCEELQDQDKKCFAYELDCEKEHPILMASDNTQLLAHTIVEDADLADGRKGREVAIEPLLGRETKDDSGFGRSFSDPEVCWVPGGKVNEGERFQIQKKGIWKRYP